MSNYREHPSFEDLNDSVDGRLEPETAARVADHLAVCEACRSEHHRLVELLSVASGIQLSVDPGDGLWEDVKRDIERRKEVALPVAENAPNRRPSKRLVRVSPAFLAAAAVVLIVLSSGITTVVLRRTPEGFQALRRSTDGQSMVLPASFRVAEDEYARTISELRIAVDAQRANLSPETIRTVDHSLAIIDSAIAEARTALIADPNNRTLVELLASSYQRKLDLLRRTSELSPKI